MDIRSIPDRNINKPFFDIQESNALLNSVRQPIEARRSISTPRGTIVEQTEQDIRPLNVKFVTTILPYSIFTVKYLDRPFYAPAPTVTATGVDHTTIRQDQAHIYATNGNMHCQGGAVVDCYVIGYDRPHLIRYTGTDPVIGDRLRGGAASSYLVSKHSAGDLMAVSQPDTVGKRIWVIRAWKKDKIYGKTQNDVIYGNTVTIAVYRNFTSTGETEVASFKWIGIAGQQIPAGAKVEAEWWDDVGYVISNGNCIAE